MISPVLAANNQIGGVLATSRRRAVTAAPLLTSLISYWNLTEASGNRLDSHTNALHLTSTNVTQVVGGGPDGGNCAEFVSANAARLAHDHNALLSYSATDMTWAAWMYPAATARHALTKGAQTELEYQIYVAGSAFQFFLYYNNTTGLQVTSSAYTLNAWAFVVAQYDKNGQTINISRNNEAFANRAYTEVPNVGTVGFRLGSRATTTANSFDGRLSYTGLWKRLLTAAERTWLYNSGAGRTYAAVAAYTG